MDIVDGLIKGGHISKEDYQKIIDNARVLNSDKFLEIAGDLVQSAFDAVRNREDEVTVYLDSVPDDWYKTPFYYTYVKYFGTLDEHTDGTFHTLTEMLQYLEYLGIKNIYLLPHYQSPQWDHGYDVSDYTAADELGGSEGYNTFMKAVREKGFRVVTDAVFNHTSIEHDWFKKALAGEEEYLDYYLKVDSWKKIGEYVQGGDVRAKYVDDEGNFMERTLIFPDVTRKHYIEIEANNKKHKIYSEFYPFQVDLDLQNPKVIKEIWQIVGRELNSGVLGKRTDAIAHWVKPKGCIDADGTSETFALHTLLKIFIKIVSSKSIIIPEAVRSIGEIRKYLGLNFEIGNKLTTSQGDAIFNFHAQGSLRETLSFCTSSAWWDYWHNHHKKVIPPVGGTWINLLGHHDEIYMGFIRDFNRQFFRDYLERPDGAGGMVYKGGMSAGSRTANCLLHDEQRIATAFFLLYMLPGVPAIYYGDEIAAVNNISHAIKVQIEQSNTLSNLGLKLPIERAFDPRELQRGPIARHSFEEKRDSLIVTVIRHLNQLWGHPVVRSEHLHDIPCGDDGIIAMEKYLDDHYQGLAFPPLIALANLTARRRVARLPFGSINERFHRVGPDGCVDFKVLIQSSLKAEEIEFIVEDHHVVVPMLPHEFMLLGA